MNRRLTSALCVAALCASVSAANIRIADVATLDGWPAHKHRFADAPPALETMSDVRALQLQPDEAFAVTVVSDVSTLLRRPVGMLTVQFRRNRGGSHEIVISGWDSPALRIPVRWMRDSSYRHPADTNRDGLVDAKDQSRNWAYFFQPNMLFGTQKGIGQSYPSN